MSEENSSHEKDFDEIELEIWKTVVSTQMHFNDLGLRVRNFGIVTLSAMLALAGVAIAEKSTVELFECEFELAPLAIYSAALIWICFWVMDRHWYHRLLLGAVSHGVKIETQFKSERPSLDLSSSIREKSPNTILGRSVHSSNRLSLFY